VEGKAIERM
jgi:hypothetical protein